MKTLYIFLTRSGTLVSNLVYALTGAEYTHISLAFDENLNTLYSSTRKNGYTMFPAGPSREYLNKGVFRLRENIPCALYALEVSDEAYARAKRRAEHMMTHGELYRFNSLGLLLCAFHIRWNRRRHYFCSQFVSEVLQKSGSLEHCPQHSNLNLFQILRQIPSTSQHTVNLHNLVFIVDAVEYQILVNDHPAISRVKAVDLAHFWSIA